MLQRGLLGAAAAIMAYAIGAALLQLAMLIFGVSSPLAITAIVLVAVVLLHSLRRRIRATASHRLGSRNPHGINR